MVNLSDMTKKQLVAKAKKKGIRVTKEKGGARKKADLVRALRCKK